MREFPSPSFATCPCPAWCRWCGCGGDHRRPHPAQSSPATRPGDTLCVGAALNTWNNDFNQTMHIENRNITCQMGIFKKSILQYITYYVVFHAVVCSVATRVVSLLLFPLQASSHLILATARTTGDGFTMPPSGVSGVCYGYSELVSGKQYYGGHLSTDNPLAWLLAACCRAALAASEGSVGK